MTEAQTKYGAITSIAALVCLTLWLSMVASCQEHENECWRDAQIAEAAAKTKEGKK